MGFVTGDDFELVEVEVPEVRKEGELLVRNIWMSVDPIIEPISSETLRPNFNVNSVLNPTRPIYTYILS